jgi:hypothetical protein
MAPVVSGSGAVAAGIIARKRRKIVRAFREHGATSADTARSLADVGLSEGLLLYVLKLKHLIVSVGGDKFYLDTAREQAVDRTRRIVVAVVALVIVAIVVVLWRMGLM